jgi:ice-binding like protein
MIKACSSPGRSTRLAAIALFAAIAFNASAASAQSAAGSTSNFAVLAGTAVTCTDGTVRGDVGVWPGTAITQTNCTVTGTVHAADSAAEQAFLGFVSAYGQLRDHPPACRATATATLNETLLRGVYCVDATAKAGVLMLDAQGSANASWTFLVNGALTGTGFRVVMLNGGQPCNVAWWVKDAATLTDSNVLGTILAGAAITVTRGTLMGNAWAKAAVTLTGPTVTACQANMTNPGPAICVDNDDHDGDHDGDHHDGDHDGHHGDDDHDKDHKDKDHDKDRKDNDSKDKKGNDRDSKGKH